MPKDLGAVTVLVRRVPRFRALLVLVVVFVSMITLGRPVSKCEFYPDLATKKIDLAGRNVTVAVADNQQLHERGLGGLSCMPKGQAMLFVFDTPANYGFWMKDMNFAIDIVWLSPAKKVTHIERDVSPSSYPKEFSPRVTAEPALYVLEFAAGYTSSNSIAVGTQFSW